MLKKLLLVAMILSFIPSVGNAVMNDTRSSGSTVTFSTVVQIVTFNTVTNWLYFRNESAISDCYVNLRNDKDVTLAGAVLKLPAYGTQTPNTVEIRYSTNGLCFISDRITPANSALNRVSYTVTGDRDNF